MQHRAQRPAIGRHRRETKLLPRHTFRNAALLATLSAGVGVASVAAATASSAHSRAVVMPVARHVEIAPAPSPPVLSSVRALRKERPAPASMRGLRMTQPLLPFARALRKEKPIASIGWVNPLPEAVVTSCFGMRWGHLHAGVDLAAPDGTPIRAAGAGVVVTEGPAEGYGNAVLIDHGDGYLTHYGHMSAITVTTGQRVVAGQQIGNEGSTGHSTGPHLHFEVHRGQYKNPIEPTLWMHQHGVDIPGCGTLTR